MPVIKKKKFLFLYIFLLTFSFFSGIYFDVFPFVADLTKEYYGEWQNERTINNWESYFNSKLKTAKEQIKKQELQLKEYEGSIEKNKQIKKELEAKKAKYEQIVKAFVVDMKKVTEEDATFVFFNNEYDLKKADMQGKVWMLEIKELEYQLDELNKIINSDTFALDKLENQISKNKNELLTQELKAKELLIRKKHLKPENKKHYDSTKNIQELEALIKLLEGNLHNVERESFIATSVPDIKLKKEEVVTEEKDFISLKEIIESENKDKKTLKKVEKKLSEVEKEWDKYKKEGK